MDTMNTLSTYGLAIVAALAVITLILRFVLIPLVEGLNRRAARPVPRATTEARLSRARRALEIAERRQSPQAARFRAQIAELEAQLEATPA